MSLLQGFNHVATVTSDLDRLIAFYEEAFDVEVVLDTHMPAGPRYRHAMLEFTPTCALHAFEVPEENVRHAGNEMFKRGRVDHLAMSVSNETVLEEVRKRLVAAGASTGDIQRFGSVISLYFEDPDGMACEVACLEEGKGFAQTTPPPPDSPFWQRQGSDS